MDKDSAYVNLVGELNDEAKRKVREDWKDTMLSVQTLECRTNYRMNTPTDFLYLLRFLRVKNYNEQEALECLENYWTARTHNPRWFLRVEPADETIQEIIKTGFQFSPKKYDIRGRRCLFVRMNKLDVDSINRWGLDNLLKASFLIYDWLLLDQNVQVNGLSVVCDFSGVTVALMEATMYTDSCKNAMSLFQNALQFSIEAIHWYNEPTFVDEIFQTISHVLEPKIKRKIYLHGNSLARIFEHVGMSVMPDEYLPDDYKGSSAGKSEDIAVEMLADMMRPEFRTYMKNLSSGIYGVSTRAKTKTDDGTS